MKRIASGAVLALLSLPAIVSGQDYGSRVNGGYGLTTTATAQRAHLTPEEAKAIAKEAYIYGFPMVMGYKAIYIYFVDKENPEYKGPFNKLSCVARLFTPEDKAIVTPNADTPYCNGKSNCRRKEEVIVA